MKAVPIKKVNPDGVFGVLSKSRSVCRYETLSVWFRHAPNWTEYNEPRTYETCLTYCDDLSLTGENAPHLSGFHVEASVYRRRPGDEVTTSLSYGYPDIYLLKDPRRADLMARWLRKVNDSLDKIELVEGEAKTFGLLVARICRIAGIRLVLERRPDSTTESYLESLKDFHQYSSDNGLIKILDGKVEKMIPNAVTMNW